MNRIRSAFVFPLALLVILIYALSKQWYNVPPIGKLLDPFIGITQNSNDRELNMSRLEISAGATNVVEIFFDNRKVPHIYASNTEDLYFAQGYVTAYLRLWQMDFISYASAGRLSEIFGQRCLDYDRNQRRLGILSAARSSLELIEKDTQTIKVLTAFSKGVNAFINKLHYKTLPFEYKLLDYQPEQWTNLKSVLIMKYFANMLSGYEEDVTMTNLMLALGEEKFNKLYPDYPPHVSPIVNNEFSTADSSHKLISKPSYLNSSFLTGPEITFNTYNPKFGSNSWAVSGIKTKSGYPILCSDPHLGLSLPAIWLEIQLTSPQMNVYGVSIPGTPAVIIGFNQHIAWGLTNGADDVKDWVKLTCSSDFKKYWRDNNWSDLRYSREEIKIRHQKSFYDTIYFSPAGPIVYDKSYTGGNSSLMHYALKWELHTPSNEISTFIKLANAQNYKDFKNAIAGFICPIQNFTFACDDNTIAINHQGNMAIKQPGEGKFLLDGTQGIDLSRKYIPADSIPHVCNPACNYVFSANQHPTYPGYPYYYNGYFLETRANRIKLLLENQNGFDIEKMKAMQLDNKNELAQEVLPELLIKISSNKFEGTHKLYLESLSKWDGDYSFSDENAALFELWWQNIKDSTWDELKRFPFPTKIPDDQILLRLIRNDENDSLFDNQTTSVKENARDIILKAFIAAASKYDNMKKGRSVKWSELHKVNIMHMTGISAFSRTNIPSPGYQEAINAISSSWGPSWRMIVELGKRPNAFGIFAGGQSGNIGSPYYDQFVTNWSEGKYFPLLFFLSKEEAIKQCTCWWKIKN